MPISFSFSIAAPNSQPTTTTVSQSQHEGEESPTSRRELQLLEDHRPWEMLDNMAPAIIDQTYAAVLEILGLRPPQEGDRHVTLSVSQRVGATDPDSPLPPLTLHVEASARHCSIYVNGGFHVGRDIIGWDLAKQLASPGQRRRSRWPPRHRLTRASIGAAMGTLYLARVDGGGRNDYWKCADDEVRPDVSGGKGMLAVLDAIRSRLDAATRLESRLLEMARARRCRGAKVREIFRVWTALEDMRREVDLDVIVRRERFRKRHRFRTISCRADVEMDVDREDEDDEVLSKRLKALHV